MPIVFPYEPGVQEWWQKCEENDLILDLEGLNKEEKAHLPEKMLKCLSRTDNLGWMLKQGKGEKKLIEK